MRIPWVTGFLPRTVVVLGLVSMLNDISSEMISPLLPLYLTTLLGAGPAVVGLVEGLAEVTASMLKLISGWLSDRGWKSRPLILGGYTFSNLSRPLLALPIGWTGVMILRVLDRIGKGVRTSPRDALIATLVDSGIRGRAFGFHRAMDHAGAMLGPLIAYLMLSHGYAIPQVFAAAVVPGALLILLLIVAVPEPAAPRKVSMPRLRWRLLDTRLRGLILAVGGMALATPPDAFLVLWASRGGIEMVWVPLLWAAAHAMRAAVAAPAGMLSDRIGRRKVVIAGWLSRILLFVAFALTQGDIRMVILLFLLYSAATAFTEGAERAVIGDTAPAEQKGTAFGLYHLVSGLLALPGAFLFGAVWEWVGMAYAFSLAALITTFSTLAFLWLGAGRE